MIIKLKQDDRTFKTRKKYPVIYADPPWNYRDKGNAGKRGASHKYKTQKDEWLKNLKVAELAEEDCILFLWSTKPFLPVALDLIKAWGFVYRTTAFTWIKKNKKANTLFWGLGNWTRANPEDCLLAVRGKPKRHDKAVHSVIVSTIGEHSAKPIETYDRIERLTGTKGIELFARNKRPGWDSFGDEL